MQSQQQSEAPIKPPVFTVVPIPSNKETDAPYYLSNIMHSFTLSQKELFAHLVTKFSLRSTYPTFNKFIRLRRWCSELAAISDELQQAIYAWLVDHDVPEEEALKAWENGKKVPLDERGNMKNLLKKMRQMKASPATEKQVEPVRIVPELKMLDKNIQRYFKFNRDPFLNEVWCNDDLLINEHQRYIRLQMEQAIDCCSILAVVGESGAGKTETKRSFIQMINEMEEQVHLVEPETLDKEKIESHTLVTALGEELEMNLKRREESRTIQVRKEVTMRVRSGEKFVLLFEEAHDLTEKMLKQLKRIWEWNDGFRKLISVVLIGHPELREKLGPGNFKVREFSKRCTQIELLPLGQNQIVEYVHHKLTRAGINRPDALITDEAIQAIYNRLLVTKGSYGVRINDDLTDISYPSNVNAWLSDAFKICHQTGETQVTPEIIAECKVRL